MNEIAGVQVLNYRGVEFVRLSDMSLGTQTEFSKWLEEYGEPDEEGRMRPVIHFAYDAAYAHHFRRFNDG